MRGEQVNQGDHDEQGDRAEKHQRARKHVFVINGSADFLDIVRELLQDEHYNVTTTNFVPKTYDQIAALQPSLLVIDIIVGQHGGWDLLRHLQAGPTTNRIPTIVVSTSPQVLKEARANQAAFGEQRFLSKPLNLDDLLGAVNDLIGPA